MNESIPLCVDCAHHSVSYSFARCDFRINPVDGTPGAFCEFERQGNCGRSGRNFKPRNAKPTAEPALEVAYVKPKTFMQRVIGIFKEQQ